MEQVAIGLDSGENCYFVDEDDDWATDIDDEEETATRIDLIWQAMRSVVMENL